MSLHTWTKVFLENTTFERIYLHHVDDLLYHKVGNKFEFPPVYWAEQTRKSNNKVFMNVWVQFLFPFPCAFHSHGELRTSYFLQCHSIFFHSWPIFFPLFQDIQYVWKILQSIEAVSFVVFHKSVRYFAKIILIKTTAISSNYWAAFKILRELSYWKRAYVSIMKQNSISWIF